MFTYTFADGQGDFYPYKGKRLLPVSYEPYAAEYSVSEFDAETGKLKSVAVLGGIGLLYDCQYDGESKTLSFTARNSIPKRGGDHHPFARSKKRRYKGQNGKSGHRGVAGPV